MKEPPDMNEFLVRNIPLQRALWARENWSKLTDLDKAELGFSQHVELDNTLH